MADMILTICEKVVLKYWQTLFFAYINILAIVALLCVKLCESTLSRLTCYQCVVQYFNTRSLHSQNVLSPI